jgi:hypothetical protein
MTSLRHDVYFRHLGLCQKPSKCLFYHKSCPIISKPGKHDRPAMVDKKHWTDLSNSKPFGRYSQSNLAAKPPNRKSAYISIAL